MLRLMIAAVDRRVQSGTVPVRWHVDRSALDAMAARGWKKLHMLLVVAPAGEGYRLEREERWVCPLTDCVEYVRFRRPGPHHVFGVIVKEDDPRTTYLKKKEGTWSTWVLSATGGSVLTERCVLVGDESNARLEVVVPEKCFAPPLRPWERRWLMWLEDGEMADECEARGRRLFAYTVKPLAWLSRAFISLLTLILAFLLGFRKLYWHAAFTLQKSPGLVDASFGSVFILQSDPDSQGSKLAKRLGPFRYAPLLVSPPVMLLVSWMISDSAANSSRPLLAAAGKILLFQGALLAGIAVVWCLDRLSQATEKQEKARKALAKEPVAEPPRTPDYLWPEILAVLADPRATSGPPPRRVRDLPPQLRTVHLHFADLKARVCRPFASS